MELPIVLSRFADFSALAGEDLAACLPLCRDAAEELSRRAISTDATAEPLCSAAAALAYYRYSLAMASGSAVPRIGHATLVTAETLAAAKALCEEYLAAAAPYLRSREFYFGQVSSQ